MFKKLLLLSLLTFSTLYGMDQRLFKYPDAKSDYVKATQEKDQSAAFDLALFYENSLKDNVEAIKWYKKSYEYGSSAAPLNLGSLYDDLNQYDKAIAWYKKAYERKDIKSAYNLGVLYYEKLKNYDKAIKWYKISYKQGNMSGANSLGYIFDVLLKDENKGIKWYEKGAQGGNPDAINNLGRTYYSKGDNIKASAYIFAMVNYGYTKKEVLGFLKNDWKIDRATLKKAYKLQQSLDIPKHYTGGID